MKFLEYSARSLWNLSAFGAFLTVGDGEKSNPMTIGWGQIGISQGKPVFTVMVRPSRFSFSFLSENPIFTVSIPKNASFREALAFCGSKSGRDYNKIKECKLETADSEFINVPGISGCEIYECRVLYKTEMRMDETCPDCNEKWYKNGDYHTVFTGEILNYKEK